MKSHTHLKICIHDIHGNYTQRKVKILVFLSRYSFSKNISPPSLLRHFNRNVYFSRNMLVNNMASLRFRTHDSQLLARV